MSQSHSLWDRLKDHNFFWYPDVIGSGEAKLGRFCILPPARDIQVGSLAENVDHSVPDFEIRGGDQNEFLGRCRGVDVDGRFLVLTEVVIVPSGVTSLKLIALSTDYPDDIVVNLGGEPSGNARVCWVTGSNSYVFGQLDMAITSGDSDWRENAVLAAGEKVESLSDSVVYSWKYEPANRALHIGRIKDHTIIPASDNRGTFKLSLSAAPPVADIRPGRRQENLLSRQSEVQLTLSRPSDNRLLATDEDPKVVAETLARLTLSLWVGHFHTKRWLAQISTLRRLSYASLFQHEKRVHVSHRSLFALLQPVRDVFAESTVIDSSDQVAVTDKTRDLLRQTFELEYNQLQRSLKTAGQLQSQMVAARFEPMAETRFPEPGLPDFPSLEHFRIDAMKSIGLSRFAAIAAGTVPPPEPLTRQDYLEAATDMLKVIIKPGSGYALNGLGTRAIPSEAFDAISFYHANDDSVAVVELLGAMNGQDDILVLPPYGAFVMTGRKDGSASTVLDNLVRIAFDALKADRAKSSGSWATSGSPRKVWSGMPFWIRWSLRGQETLNDWINPLNVRRNLPVQSSYAQFDRILSDPKRGLPDAELNFLKRKSIPSNPLEWVARSRAERDDFPLERDPSLGTTEYERFISDDVVLAGVLNRRSEGYPGGIFAYTDSELEWLFELSGVARRETTLGKLLDLECQSGDFDERFNKFSGLKKETIHRFFRDPVLENAYSNLGLSNPKDLVEFLTVSKLYLGDLAKDARLIDTKAIDLPDLPPMPNPSLIDVSDLRDLLTQAGQVEWHRRNWVNDLGKWADDSSVKNLLAYVHLRALLPDKFFPGNAQIEVYSEMARMAVWLKDYLDRDELGGNSVYSGKLNAIASRLVDLLVGCSDADKSAVEPFVRFLIARGRSPHNSKSFNEELRNSLVEFSRGDENVALEKLRKL